jgi:hypothetical protein
LYDLQRTRSTADFLTWQKDEPVDWVTCGAAVSTRAGQQAPPVRERALERGGGRERPPVAVALAADLIPDGMLV